MFDDEDDSIFTTDDDDSDDFEYYVSYIKALEEEDVSKGIIVRELMDEFDLEKDEAVKILKRYYARDEEEDDDDEDEEDIVEDDDYSDGNSER